MSGKRVSNGYASLCVNWKRTRSLDEIRAFLRPHLQHLQILLHFLHYPTLSPSIIQAYLFITITLYLLWIFGDDQNAFSRWLTFLRSPLPALALPAKPTLPLPQAGSRLVGENKFHVVENDGGSLEAIAKKI